MCRELSKIEICVCRNYNSHENIKLKISMCAQSMSVGTPTKSQLEILTIDVIDSIMYLREIILESSANVSETSPRWRS